MIELFAIAASVALGWVIFARPRHTRSDVLTSTPVWYELPTGCPACASLGWMDMVIYHPSTTCPDTGFVEEEAWEVACRHCRAVTYLADPPPWEDHI